MANTWVLLGKDVVTTGTEDSLGVSWTGDYKYLHIEYCMIQAGSNGSEFRLGTTSAIDSGTDRYYFGYSSQDGTTTGGKSNRLWGNWGGANDLPYWSSVDIGNLANTEKTVRNRMSTASGSAGSTAPNMTDWWAKWFNDSDLIQQVEIAKESGKNGFSVGSVITVWGAGGAGTFTYPNLKNGTTFLTSDTNLLYMFDGVSAWNLVS